MLKGRKGYFFFLVNLLEVVNNFSVYLVLFKLTFFCGYLLVSFREGILFEIFYFLDVSKEKEESFFFRFFFNKFITFIISVI